MIENPKTRSEVFLIVPTIIAVLLILNTWFLQPALRTAKMNTGLRLLYALYEYIPNEIDQQDSQLKKILSPELYDRYTLGSDQRQLRIYLKFQNTSAIPKVLYNEPGRIIFWLQSSEITSDRVFQIDYKTQFGKVIAINEAELFYLPPSNRGYYV